LNIEELEAQLPNGLHDSLLRTFSSDPQEGRAEFILDVWIGDLESQTTLDRERRRAARLELLGLAYLVVDVPDPSYRFRDSSPLQIDTCAADDDLVRAGQVPEGGFAGRFFVAEWNSFIHFAALDACLTWIDVN